MVLKRYYCVILLIAGNTNELNQCNLLNVKVQFIVVIDNHYVPQKMLFANLNFDLCKYYFILFANTIFT